MIIKRVDMTIKRLAFEPVLIAHLNDLGVDHRSVSAAADFRTLDPQQRLYRLAGFAFRATSDPLLGLKIGRKMLLSTFGALAHAFLSAPTLRHAFQLEVRHMRLFQPQPRNATSLSQEAGRLYLNYNHPVRLPEIPNFIPDVFFATTLQLIRLLSGGELKAFRIEISYAVPDRAAYEAEIGIPVEWMTGHNRLSAPAEFMSRRLPGAYAIRSEAHMRLAENVLGETYAGYGIQQRVIEVLLQEINVLPKAPKAPEVARLLNVSERSLRRQLHASGASFAALADQVRLNLARAYLSELPVRDVAELLGYHDASTFRRTFKRLAGVTPAQFIRSSPRVVKQINVP